jgi:L-alanine-DL-glutamate epimerase-like enolase superfamily enzyme
VVVAELREGGLLGRGEAVPYARYGESPEAVVATLEGLAGAVAAGLDREGLARLLPAGAARNALDCALWDLEARRAGRPVWQLAGLGLAPGPVVTAFTLSLDRPEAMAAAARAAGGRPLLKLKLGGQEVLERVRAVRAAVPRARLMVDANEAWSLDQLHHLAPELARLGVELIEQPLPAGADDGLRPGAAGPVPLAADESCHGRDSLERLVGRYQLINIKLDKTGGLTEALRLKAAAEAAGLGIMVGCMVATSLAMAPALLVAQGAAVVDLDGPLLLAVDRVPGLRYESATVYPPEPGLWG